jgi:hypothetical protein
MPESLNPKVSKVSWRQPLKSHPRRSSKQPQRTLSMSAKCKPSKPYASKHHNHNKKMQFDNVKQPETSTPVAPKQRSSRLSRVSVQRKFLQVSNQNQPHPKGACKAKK